VRAIAEAVRQAIPAATGLTGSVGAGTSKLIAKIASELAKPDGHLVVEAGAEGALLDPLPVSRLWGVGPATAERLRRLGVGTVQDLRAVPAGELVALLGPALGAALERLARADDDRPVVPVRESKSVSAEDTFPRDVVDLGRLHAELDLLSTRVAERLRRHHLAGRTVTVKVRRHDFVTVNRSTTLGAPTDDAATVRRAARRLLGQVDTSDGVRLLGVGVSGLADWAQGDLFAAADGTGGGGAHDDGTDRDGMNGADPARVDGSSAGLGSGAARRWVPGQDVAHRELGRGWVQGSGLGRVTVRLESRASAPGPVRTFAADDPDLSPVDPEPLGAVPDGPDVP
jgi:DNA polymerase-4